MFKILFIGDIFGRIGREMVLRYLPKIIAEYDVDFVIANSENATHGKGLILRHYQELIDAGVSCLTMGNHTYAKRQIFDYIEKADRLVVPYNQSKALPGMGSRVFICRGKTIRVTSMLGLVFMDGHPANPFEAIDDVLKEDTCDLHIIDFHGEATSEKIAFGYYVDGKATAVLGTHTHVATADERLLPKGTAFQCDVGMTGPYESVIGCDVDSIIERNVKGIMTPFKLAEGYGILHATLMTINDDNMCETIQRICVKSDGDLLKM